MKNTLIKIIVLLGFLSSTTSADVRYVKDEVYVPLRSGPSSQHRILHKGIKSNTKLDLLEANNTDGWVNVKTPSGLEGWIPAQYLVSEPTAQIKLANASAKAAELSKKNRVLLDTNQAQNKELIKIKSDLSKTSKEKQNISLELHRIKSISSGAIELDEKYQRLLEQYQLLQTENDTINAENENLKSDRRFSYMFYGAALIIIGMFMAVLIPRLKITKRHSEWAN